MRNHILNFITFCVNRTAYDVNQHECLVNALNFKLSKAYFVVAFSCAKLKLKGTKKKT